MKILDLSADELSDRLLVLAESENVCILDSCGVGHLNSHLMIAGISPHKTLHITSADAEETLRVFTEEISGSAAVFTLSYDFGLKLQNIVPANKQFPAADEPDIYLALFDCLLIHDYDTRKTFLTGNEGRFDEIAQILAKPASEKHFRSSTKVLATSNFTRADYLEAINSIRDRIRAGDTYQTNLTQQITVELPHELRPETIFRNLRKDNPAPFAAFIRRGDSTVISASPERFLNIKDGRISVSPIKGTRPRGVTPEQDDLLRSELLNSEKDRAENIMIVDLMRNDIGRICEFGSVDVETLCEIEEHPTLFHLVSTVSGKLRAEISFADVIKAVFPCGSITGAPKVSTMQIIDQIETAGRGLSMGSIGYYIPEALFDIPGSFDMSVAIRTMTVRDDKAVFNVGGGIVIDSDPKQEFDETLTKAKALLNAMNAVLE